MPFKMLKLQNSLLLRGASVKASTFLSETLSKVIRLPEMVCSVSVVIRLEIAEDVSCEVS